ncbi:hypothetical protein [Bacillus sp. SG-1]|uniref:hypothetical protein n=1 Tax=Bacillus sp. SG-1 TaxID=161544 RepID=UPI0012EA8939|nr:hypothetical protein [Bacillus sp. SG-1]
MGIIQERWKKLDEEERINLGVTIGILFFTGLSGHALSHIKVNDVDIDKEWILYEPDKLNSKLKPQCFPIPQTTYA